MRNSIHNNIKEDIYRRGPGELIFPDLFLSLGSAESIHTALSRLVKEKIIIRLGRGIYQKPKIDSIVGKITPSLEEIARAIAEREQVIIRPTGAYALNILGLSSQVPTKVVYLTNGSPRLIRIGKATIRFKSTTPKKLASSNEMLFLVAQALEELGPKGVSQAVIERIAEIMKSEPLSDIRETAKFAPQFVARILYKLVDTLGQND